ncbi:MAG: TetR/AcrR family transcriptional regulator, partial [Lachnospiraceae bacterium]|nr:TetR/AcrR family transcriptional regulator [Lachnospiraceae bacterium]
MKKELKTELTKEKIILAAIDEFGRNGYYGSSLNSICDTGIAKGLLYHNFANKNAIYLACVQRCFH